MPTRFEALKQSLVERLASLREAVSELGPPASPDAALRGAPDEAAIAVFAASARRRGLKANVANSSFSSTTAASDHRWPQQTGRKQPAAAAQPRPPPQPPSAPPRPPSKKKKAAAAAAEGGGGAATSAAERAEPITMRMRRMPQSIAVLPGDYRAAAGVDEVLPVAVSLQGCVGMGQVIARCCSAVSPPVFPCPKALFTADGEEVSTVGRLSGTICYLLLPLGFSFSDVFLPPSMRRASSAALRGEGGGGLGGGGGQEVSGAAAQRPRSGSSVLGFPAFVSPRSEAAAGSGAQLRRRRHTTYSGYHHSGVVAGSRLHGIGRDAGKFYCRNVRDRVSAGNFAVADGSSVAYCYAASSTAAAAVATAAARSPSPAPPSQQQSEQPSSSASPSPSPHAPAVACDATFAGAWAKYCGAEGGGPGAAAAAAAAEAAAPVFSCELATFAPPSSAYSHSGSGASVRATPPSTDGLRSGGGSSLPRSAASRRTTAALAQTPPPPAPLPPPHPSRVVPVRAGTPDGRASMQSTSLPTAAPAAASAAAAARPLTPPPIAYDVDTELNLALLGPSGGPPRRTPAPHGGPHPYPHPYRFSTVPAAEAAPSALAPGTILLLEAATTAVSAPRARPPCAVGSSPDAQKWMVQCREPLRRAVQGAEGAGGVWGEADTGAPEKAGGSATALHVRRVVWGWELPSGESTVGAASSLAGMDRVLVLTDECATLAADDAALHVVRNPAPCLWCLEGATGTLHSLATRYEPGQCAVCGVGRRSAAEAAEDAAAVAAAEAEEAAAVEEEEALPLRRTLSSSLLSSSMAGRGERTFGMLVPLRCLDAGGGDSDSDEDVHERKVKKVVRFTLEPPNVLFFVKEDFENDSVDNSDDESASEDEEERYRR